MARQVDESKMERINNAAIELIVEKGYGGASISSIARKAGVAEGYLYRFHTSKQELINSLLHNRINAITSNIQALLESRETSGEIIDTLVNEYFTLAESSPQVIKFLYVLMHDYNFLIHEEQRKEIKALIGRLKELGKQSGDIATKVSDEEIYQMIIIYPLVFLNMRIKGFFGQKTWSLDDKTRVVEFCKNALKL